MADTFSPTDRSRVMAAVRSRGNQSTELALASALRRHGLKGWRRHAVIATQGPAGSQVRVKPDFVFRKLRLAVFVDGYFWHVCPKHFAIPKTCRTFWRRKLPGNRSRDFVVIRTLPDAGWMVIRLWGARDQSQYHQLRQKDSACGRIVCSTFAPLENSFVRH